MMDESLDKIAELAREYAHLALRDKREEKPLAMEIVNKIKNSNVVEMAFFCQQVISYCPDIHLAAAILTAFTNRLIKQTSNM